MKKYNSKKNKKVINNKNLFLVPILLFIIVAIVMIVKPKVEEKSNVNTQTTVSDFTDYATSNNHNKVVVVYFSATGNTKKVSEKIAKIFNCDTIAIEPVVPYSHEDLTSYDLNTRPQKESRYNPFEPPAEPEENVEVIDDGEIKSLPAIKEVNLNEYNTIFLGYPIWFGDAPRVVYTFINETNLNDKVIIPFCTSDNDGISPSDQNLANFASNSVKFTLGKKFEKDSSEKEIKEFFKKVGISLD